MARTVIGQRIDRRAQRRQRRGHGTHSRRGREGRRCRGARRARRVRGLGQHTGGDARRLPAEDFRRPEGTRRRARQDHRAGGRHAAQALRPHPGRAADRQLRQLRKTAARVRVGKARRQFAGGARAGRRGRGDHALELSAAPDHAEARAGARRRLHRGAQALGSGAVQRFHIGRSHRAVRSPQGCIQSRHRLRPERGRGAGKASGRRHDLVHRLDARRQENFRAGRAGREARRARARR